MGYTDYMKQVNNGNVLIDFGYVPDKVFIDANQVRGIYKAKIMTREQRKNRPAGSGDVILTSASGGTQIITRDELCKNYKHSSGKNIVVAFLKSNTNYVVQSNASDKYKIAKLPDNCIGKVNGKSAKPGSYIICKVDASGNPDKNTMTIVSPQVFRKMFKIPMQSIIKRHMNGGENRMFGLFNADRNRSITNNRNTDTPNINIGGISGFKANLAKDTEQHISLSKKPQVSLGKAPQVSLGKAPETPESKYRFKATHRIVSMENKKVVGFVIVDKTTNQSKQLTIPQVHKLCEQKTVENLKLVIKDVSGIRFLQGNGIRIESLPEVIA